MNRNVGKRDTTRDTCRSNKRQPFIGSNFTEATLKEGQNKWQSFPLYKDMLPWVKETRKAFKFYLVACELSPSSQL